LTLHPPLAVALERATGRRVTGGRRVGGGDINDAWAVELDGGTRAFVKTRPDAPAGEYATEAAGLRWLAEPRALAVPEVLAVGDSEEGPRFLALEWVDEGALDAAGEEALGRGLAAVHGAGAPAFGAAPPGGSADLRIGPLLLPNDPLPDWPSFYAERRLRPLLPAAALSQAGVRAVERVCERLPEIAGDPEPPARLHGDLWGGNVLAGADGRPWLIDPAAYGGHREVDLAMLALFGGARPRTLAAYQEAAPLTDGWEERVGLWQLFPLLVHAALFGGGYGASVERTARRYVG
jgi:fructosamine-3-kinase